MLDFSKRKPQRERTLLSSINDVKITKVVKIKPDIAPAKVFEKNTSKHATKEAEESSKGEKNGETKSKAKARAPDANRHPEEFMQFGGKGDQTLFAHDSSSKMT